MGKKTRIIVEFVMQRKNATITILDDMVHP